CLQGYIDPYSF
nr:immunoglobulin light chain junction region [Macaca mulatta]MOV78310.1 immunoglobulin light chain junction region [Macaca mulatta]MOV78726.1 immunoglobulin light chain junction region [Macaca mulatta]MOV79985.1 immunoglobulin light chain junction region [Macaca mulatta]MOV81214.1 immunoglobulin light chain junction region [Macaca mulatta]